MLYFDERDVSRKYDISIERNVVRWQRNSPDFSQRMVLTVADDGRTMVGKGEMSQNGGAWEPDLELTYSGAKPPKGAASIDARAASGGTRALQSASLEGAPDRRPGP